MDGECSLEQNCLKYFTPEISVRELLYFLCFALLAASVHHKRFGTKEEPNVTLPKKCSNITIFQLFILCSTEMKQLLLYNALYFNKNIFAPFLAQAVQSYQAGCDIRTHLVLSVTVVQYVHHRLCSGHRASQILCIMYCGMMLECTAAISRRLIIEHGHQIQATDIKSISRELTLHFVFDECSS